MTHGLAVAAQDAARPQAQTLQIVQPERPPPVLNAVVSEFLDAGNTGLGKPVAYLLWREAFAGIREQSGAGVEMARSDKGESLVSMHGQRYHIAAEEIASRRDASLALWGAVRAEGNRVFIWSYLTILPDTDLTSLDVKLTVGKGRPATLNVVIPKKRFSFAPVETTRNDLFSRIATVRQQTSLRAAPSAHAKVIQKLAPEGLLKVLDWENEWLQVETAGNQVGYVELWPVDILPKSVAINKHGTKLRAEPDLRSKELLVLGEGSQYEILNMRLVGPDKKAIAWFEVRSEDATGWVPAWETRIHYSLPALHFAVALQRFMGRHYAEAKSEMDQYLKASSDESDNVNLATALQVVGASELLGDVVAGSQRAFERFAKAIELTPFDPAAYKLRVLAAIELPKKWTHVPEDLEKALELDVRDTHTREMLKIVEALFAERSKQSKMANDIVQKLRALQKKYQVVPLR